MRTLFLQEHQGIVLTRSAALAAGNEPLGVRFGLICFSLSCLHGDVDAVQADISTHTAIRRLQLQPGEELRLLPGEQLLPHSEPFVICFGQPDFSASGKSEQERITASIVRCLRCAIPSNWHVEGVKFFRRMAERINTPIVSVIPARIEWKRTAKCRQYREHTVDIVVTGQLDADHAIHIIDQWAELFLDGGGPLEHACMSAETLDIAEAGYSIDALSGTPSAFVGGLQLTFWEL